MFSLLKILETYDNSIQLMGKEISEINKKIVALFFIHKYNKQISQSRFVKIKVLNINSNKFIDFLKFQSESRKKGLHRKNENLKKTEIMTGISDDLNKYQIRSKSLGKVSGKRSV